VPALHHEPFGLQLHDRVADRAAAQPELLRQRAVRGVMAGGQPAVENHSPDGTVGNGRLVWGRA
jgi:hypothetical protein